MLFDKNSILQKIRRNTGSFQRTPEIIFTSSTECFAKASSDKIYIQAFVYAKLDFDL